MSAYAQAAAAEPFTRSREMFAAVVAELESAGTTRCTHGELEGLLTTRSRELVRTLVQDHLDLRPASSAARR
jgi:hypothetical protein